MAEPDKSIAEMAQEIVDGVNKANAQTGLVATFAPGILKGKLQSAHQDLLSSKETPEESIAFVKEEIAKALGNGEISPELSATMTEIIDSSGQDSSRFAGLVTANVDKISAGLAAPAGQKVTTPETVVVADGGAPTEVDAEIEAPESIANAAILSEPGQGTDKDDNFMTLLISGEFDLENMMDGLDFKNNPMQAIQGIMAMVSAIFNGEDPMAALEQFKQDNLTQADPVTVTPAELEKVADHVINTNSDLTDNGRILMDALQDIDGKTIEVDQNGGYRITNPDGSVIENGSSTTTKTVDVASGKETNAVTTETDFDPSNLSKIIDNGQINQEAMSEFLNKNGLADIATKISSELDDAGLEEDKNYTTGPNGTALMTIVTGQDIGADTSAKVDLNGENGVTIAGQSAPNRFNDLSNPDAANVKVVDPTVDPAANAPQTKDPIVEAPFATAGLGG